MELAQDRVQWQALVLAVLNLPILLPELISNMSLSGEVVRMERGWEWLRIVYNGRL